MEEQSVLQKRETGCRGDPHNFKGQTLGWILSFDEKVSSALGYCLPVSARWTSLAVVACQIDS